MICGIVKRAFTISSHCRCTQSMTKSGNPATRLFFTFTIVPRENGFEESISIPTEVPVSHAHIRNTGHPRLRVPVRFWRVA